MSSAGESELEFDGRPAWAEVSLGAIRYNLRAIRRRVGHGRKVLAIVKANAYAHGAVAVARALAAAGADCFGVTCAAEGIELREAGIRQPILVLSGYWPGEERNLVKHHLTPAIGSLEQLRHFARTAARAQNGYRHRYHLKIETGMNRLGIPAGEVRRFAAAAADAKNLRLEGTFTHFASSENFRSEQTAEQEKVFHGALRELREERVPVGLVHLANSAAIVSRPSTWQDMVRPGALLYGYHQFYEPPQREGLAYRRIPLRPALSLRARIIALRDVPVGAGVGYNARFVAQRPSRIAVLAAGYADGVVRRLGGRGHVLIHGRPAPIVGIVSMDLTTVDVTDLPGVRMGDVATIFGTCGPRGPVLRASDLAHQLDTVTSDVLCAVGPRVPRFYVD
jgi:alanine racemase